MKNSGIWKQIYVYMTVLGRSKTALALDSSGCPPPIWRYTRQFRYLLRI